MINVIIPSYKRADRLVGRDYFHMAKYCIPKSQEEEYLKHIGADRLIVIPDECDGSIVKKRNWILQNIPRPLVMIDDDVYEISYWENRKENYLRRKFDSQLLEEWLERGFELCEGFGCKMWGLMQNTDDRSFKENLPFSLTNIILGPFQAHTEHDLLFDERMGTKEDYDMSLQQLNKYKKVMRWNKFAYDCEHGDNKGGIVSYRTMEKEKEWCGAIEKKWGRNIIKYPENPKKMGDLLNGKVFVPIRGV